MALPGNMNRISIHVKYTESHSYATMSVSNAVGDMVLTHLKNVAETEKDKLLKELETL